MKLQIQIILLLCFVLVNSNAQQIIRFNALEELYAYAEVNSITLRNSSKQTDLVKHQTLASKLKMLNLKSTGNFTLTENKKLSPNFIPSEIFGGQEGTFRTITLGQKYVSNYIIEPQIDLINPYAMAQIKVGKTNEHLTLVNNLLTKKELFENISATYHNILSIKWQIEVTTKSLSNAEKLVVFLQNKQKEGLVRIQDVNVTLASQLLVKGKLQQLEIQLLQQYNSLKILCDINIEATVVINEKQVNDIQLPNKATGDLLQRQAEWQTKYYQAILKADKRWMYPTLSLFSSFSWLESNNNSFFGTSNWFSSNYIGLKISIPILPEISKISAVKQDRINLEIAKNNWSHSKLLDQINNNQLELDYRKAYESYIISTKIELLRKETYEKNLNIYQEGILAVNELISSFDEWLNSSLNNVMLLATLEYAKSKINISNIIK